MRAEARTLSGLSVRRSRWQERYLSYRFWRALHNPPATHPYFRRDVLRTLSDRPFRRNWTGLFIGTVVLLADFSPMLLMFLMPPLLIISGLTYGLEIAIRLGYRIARARESDMFDLLATAPAGSLGTSWVIGASELYRDRQFEQFSSIIRASLLIAFAGTSALSLLSIICQSDILTRLGDPIMPALSQYLNLALALTAVYLEFIQSTVFACLLAMLIPTITRGHTDAVIYAGGLFLLAQVITYLATGLVGFLVLPGLFDRIAFHGLLAESLLAASRLVIFGMVHELLIAFVWRVLLLRLNGRPSDMVMIFRSVVDD